METQKTSKTFEIKSDHQKESQFTLLVYFKQAYAENGSEKGRKFHSNKYELVEKQGKLIVDHKHAYDRLTNYLMTELSGRYKTAIIYHNPTNSIVYKMSYNAFRGGKQVEFMNDATKLGTVFKTIGQSIRLEY
jgi:hypothetical protein